MAKLLPLLILSAMTLSIFAGCAGKGLEDDFKNYSYDTDEKLRSLNKQDESLATQQNQLSETVTSQLTQMTQELDQKKQELDTRIAQFQTAQNDFTKKYESDYAAFIEMQDRALEALAVVEKESEKLTKMEKDLYELSSLLGGDLEKIEGLMSENQRELVALREETKNRDDSLSGEIRRTENQLARRIDLTEEKLLNFQYTSKDWVTQLREAFNQLGSANREILTLQRQQFEDMVESYKANQARIEPWLPENTLSDFSAQDYNPEEAVGRRSTSSEGTGDVLGQNAPDTTTGETEQDSSALPSIE